MPLKIQGGGNRRGAGVGGEGTAPEEPRKPQNFYSRGEMDGDVLDIPLSDISPNPFNDIRSMGDLNGLAQSITEDGLLQSIVVMHTEEFVKKWPAYASGENAITTKYVIAFGERRWRAMEKAGGKTISSVLNNSIIEKIRRVLLIENLQRQAYSAIEEARNFFRLHNEENMSYREIAKELKIGSTHVSRQLSLMFLPRVVQDAIGKSIKVTDARRLARDLKDMPEEQEAAWRLAVERKISIKKAIDAVIAGEKPVGEDVPESELSEDDLEEENSAEDVDLPEQRSDDEKSTEELGQGESANAPGAETTEAEKEPEKKAAPEKKPAPKPRPTPDHSARERDNAAADRTEACLHLIRSDFTPDAKQLSALYARTLLSPIQQGPAKSRAHGWLRQAGKDVIGVNDSDSYFQAVLSSGNDELVQLATFVTALAASEIRAKDNRRQWDRTDAAHVEFLIQAANYVPSTQWERDQLSKFNVAYAANEPADDPAV